MQSLSSKSQATLAIINLHISISLCYSFLLMPGWWLSYSHRRSVGKSKYPYTLSGISYVCDLGKAATFGVTNWILRDTGTVPVKRGRIGFPHIYKEPSLSQCNLTRTCLRSERPTTNCLSNADRIPEWSSYMPITTQTEWKQRLVPKQC
jgi:hypothetical protein